MTITTTIRHSSSPDSETMIFSFLRNHPQGALTTITREGVLQSSIINSFDLDNYYLAFMTKKDTRKYKNLQQNPIVSFISYDDFGRTEVEIEGIARLVTDKAQEAEIMEIIKVDETRGRRHVSPYVKETDDHVVFIIYPRKVHMTTYWEKETGVETFHESIEFNISMTS